MWGHGLFTQYTARILLPGIFMAAVLINFAMPLFQMGVVATNAVCHTLQNFSVHDNLATFAASYNHDPNAGTWEIITTGALAAGFGVLAVSYLVRYAVLIVLAITAPISALLFMLPEPAHLSKLLASTFPTNLFIH